MGIVKIGRVEADVSRSLAPKAREKLIANVVSNFEISEDKSSGVAIREVVEHMRKSAGVKSLWALDVLDKSGSLPQITGFNPSNGRYRFDTLSAESPLGFRNCFYNKQGERDHQEMYGYKPIDGNALSIVSELGANLWTEEYYLERRLKAIKSGVFLDENSSSWLLPNRVFYEYPGLEGRFGSFLGSMKVDNPEILEIDFAAANESKGLRCSLWV